MSSSSSSSSQRKLRFVTYLSPDIPVQVFETFMFYLEEVTGLDTHLLYESRYTGPPADKADPFETNEVDIGFMSSTDFLRMLETCHSVEMCEAGPVHEHEKNLGRAVYFCDLIINSINGSKYKELHDLRGHTLAYSSPSDLTSLALVEHLKKQGFDASFFRDRITAGSHLAAIESVVNTQADLAAVNSTCLERAMKSSPTLADSVQVIASLGPLPSYSIVFNKNLPGDLKKTITDALLNMKNDPKWMKSLESFNISGFVPCDLTLYDLERDIKESVGTTVNTTAYY